uniref:Uncharacterized protein n=1 Tax=Anguilla anguilla TaxID=7936 RepID=A0A0E9QBP8_ANGAN
MFRFQFKTNAKNRHCHFKSLIGKQKTRGGIQCGYSNNCIQLHN